MAVRLRIEGGAWHAVSAGGKSQVSVPVRSGQRYEVQLQARRVWMVGPWGPVTRFRTAPAPRPPTHVRWAGRTVRWDAVAGATTYTLRHRAAPGRRWTVLTTRSTAVRFARKDATARAVTQVRVTTAAGTSTWRQARH